MDIKKLRAWWWHKQGLDGRLRGQPASTILAGDGRPRRGRQMASCGLSGSDEDARMDSKKLRARWWHKQGLDGRLRGQSAAAILEQTGWARSVGGRRAAAAGSTDGELRLKWKR